MDIEMHIPDGWKLVPTEPDSLMLEACENAVFEHVRNLPKVKRGWRVNTETKARLRYAAMLNAAPVFQEAK